MSDEKKSIVLEKLKERFGDAILAVHSDLGDDTALVVRERIVEIMTFLRDDPALKFNFAMDLTGVDYLGETPRFEVVYHLHSMKHGHRLRLKAPVEEEDAAVPTVSGVWRTACWHERETYDMFGIKFEGHSDLRRILMPDDWDGYPLRKDYPIEGPEWKFEPW